MNARKIMATNLDYVPPDKVVESEPKKPESKGEPRKRKNEEISEEISKLSLQEPLYFIRTEFGVFYKLSPQRENNLKLTGKQDLCCYNRSMGICLVHDPSVRQVDGTNLTMGDVLFIHHGSPATIKRILDARDKAHAKMQLENREKRQRVEAMDCKDGPSEVPKGADEIKDC